MDINGLYDEAAQQSSVRFLRGLAKQKEELPNGWRFAEIGKDEPVIEKFIGRLIRACYPSNFLLESMQEMMMRAGREIPYSHSAETWHYMTSYIKKKNFVDLYSIGLKEFVLIDDRIVLQLQTGRNTREFSLRSEIQDFYRKYAGDSWIKKWEIAAFDSLEKIMSCKYMDGFYDEILRECTAIAKKDLNDIFGQPFVKTIRGFYDHDKDTLEFRAVAKSGGFPASTYIEEDGYKVGIFKAKTKTARTQHGKVSVIFENVLREKEGHLVPIITDRQHEFNNLMSLLEQ